MQLPKIKPKFHTSLNTVLTLAVVLTVLSELYLVYIYIYKSFTTVPTIVESSKVVRVDNTAYKSTINLLDSLENYSPEHSIPINPNPMK